MGGKGKSESDKRRMGHKGWMLTSMSVDQCIKVSPITFSKAKLMEMGYPNGFIWPVVDDFDGARMLVDAVMSRNTEQIRALNGRHPLADFGLADWMEEVDNKHDQDCALVVKVVKTQPLPRGFRLEWVLETNTITNDRKLTQRLMSGRLCHATKLIAVDKGTTP